MMKKCAFPHARHIYSLENYFTGGRCQLAWRVLTQAEENYRGEPHEILVKCFKNFVYPLVCTQKKKDRFRTVFQNILFISQFMNCFITARGKSKLKQPAYRSMNSNLINKEFVNSFFPVNLRRSQCFVTAEDRHLYNVMKLLKSLHLR